MSRLIVPLIALLCASLAAQEPPAPPLPPLPPAPRVDPPYPTPAPAPPGQIGGGVVTPVPGTSPRADRPGRGRSALAKATAGQDASSAEAIGRLRESLDVGRMIAEAADATGLGVDVVGHAVEAFRATFVAEKGFRVRTGDATVTHRPGAAAGHDTFVISRGEARVDELASTEAAERNFANAVESLPESAREAFKEWAARRRVQITDLAAAIVGDLAPAEARADEAARHALTSLAEARRAYDHMLRVQPDLLGHQGVLNDVTRAKRALELQQETLAEALSRLGRQRIETTLDRSLIDRYGALATRVDQDAARRAVEQLLKGQAQQELPTDPGLLGGTEEDLAKRIEALHVQRADIDAAIEHATNELIRERARKLAEEAELRKREVEERRRAQGRESPSGQAPAGGAPFGEAPDRERTRTDPFDGEIRRLREELQSLRQELEALRARKEPK